MSSIIEGYNYDIFISYRQKDNKGGRQGATSYGATLSREAGWVSEFVEALKTELESTFKEDISIYFDENPHDGLLETHDVDASLKEKLKCLIFIPVISRTFCDPKAFAWQHEFLAFIEQASADKFGLKVTLPTGNVATRVLPVRIHELGPEDTQLCEEALGTSLRGVDFIYKAPGVNRPLRHEEDHPKDNLTKTYYRDQINKVANAISDILMSLNKSNEQPSIRDRKPHNRETWNSEQFKLNKKILERKIKKNYLLVIGIILLSAIFILYLRFNGYFIKNSIGVFAFTNPPDDPALSKEAISFLDEIIIKLSKVKGLTVASRSLSKQYLNQPVPLDKLKKDYKINYLVEFNLSGIGENKKLWVGLTRIRDYKQLWSDQYKLDDNQLVTLFTNVVYAISGNLKIDISPEEINNIEKTQTISPLAYKNYLEANGRLFTALGNLFVDSASFSSAVQMYDKAIEADSGFAEAYARRAIARAWGIYTRQLNRSDADKCLEDIAKASILNKNLPDLKIANGFYYYYCTKDYIKALINFNTASILDPGDYQPLFFMAMVYRKMGDWNNSQALINRVLKFNPQDAMYLTNIGLSYTYLHNYDSALIYHQKAIKANREWAASYFNKIETLILKYGTTSKSRALLDSISSLTGSGLNEIGIRIEIYDRRYAEALRKTQITNEVNFKFSGNKYLLLGSIYKFMNNSKIAESYFDSASVSYENRIATDSSNAEIQSLLGMAYAGKGSRENAISAGKRAVDLTIRDKNALDESDVRLNLAKIYSSLGLSDEALNIIEYSLDNPACFSIKQLLIDPVWDPIRANPRYLSLISSHTN